MTLETRVTLQTFWVGVDFSGEMTVQIRVTLEEKLTLEDLNEGHVEESVDQVLSEKAIPHLKLN